MPDTPSREDLPPLTDVFIDVAGPPVEMAAGNACVLDLTQLVVGALRDELARSSIPLFEGQPLIPTRQAGPKLRTGKHDPHRYQPKR